MTSESVERVVIVDDDRAARDSYAYAVEDADFEAVKVEGPIGSLETFLTSPYKRWGALCDFELGVANFATFTGAELAASLYRHQVPAVLCTRFEKAQLDRIRPYRRWIPRLLTPSDLNPDSLRDSLQIAMKEFAGDYQGTRSPHRALIRVVETDPDDSRSFLFEMPGWSTETMLRYRFADLPPTLRPHIEPGFRTHVCANLGAEEFEDLYFTDWQGE